MKNLIVAAVILVATVAGIGYMQGWFTVTKTESETGERQYNVTIHDDKIEADKQKLKEKIHGAEETAAEDLQVEPHPK